MNWSGSSEDVDKCCDGPLALDRQRRGAAARATAAAGGTASAPAASTGPRLIVLL